MADESCTWWKQRYDFCIKRACDLIFISIKYHGIESKLTMVDSLLL
jgi:hypothetical protein